MVFKYDVQILEKHLDTFGHVNNARYLELLEEARWDFITKAGFGLEAIKKLKQGPVLLEINIKYRQELKNRERITIESKCVSAPAKIMTLEQKMIKEDGSVACKASLVVGMMDLVQRKLIEPTPLWLKAIGVES